MSEELSMGQTFGLGHNSGRNTPQTLAYVPPDAEHILAAPRIALTKVIPLIQSAGKYKWIEGLKIKVKFDCCRRVENLDIEAWYSKQSEKDAERPDIYKFYCRECEAIHQEDADRGYCHAVFCVGGSHPAIIQGKVKPEDRPDLVDFRPLWEVR